jgi:protein CpxP
MNKESLYRWIIGVLLLSNLLLIAYHFLGHHFFHKHFSPREKIIKELKLDNTQQVTFDSLYVNHRAEIDTLQQQIAKKKKVIYNTLGAGASFSPETDSLFFALNQLQLQLEKSHYLHFQQLRTILRQNQLADFDRFLSSLQDHIHRHHHRKHHHKH